MVMVIENRGGVEMAHTEMFTVEGNMCHISDLSHLSQSSLLPQTLQFVQMCLCLFVLCHLAAPDESENFAQSDDETENGTLLSQSLFS